MPAWEDRPGQEDSHPHVALAWAAGIFEGEGTFSGRLNQEARGSKRQDRGLTAKLKMSDEDVVRRFASIVRVGNVTGPYLSDGVGTKPLWVWQTGSFEGVQHVMATLWPWLHLRRKRRIKDLLTFHHANPRRRNGRYPVTA